MSLYGVSQNTAYYMLTLPTEQIAVLVYDKQQFDML